MFLHGSVVYTLLLYYTLSIRYLKNIRVFSDFSYEYLCIISFVLDKCLGVRLLGHMVSIYFTLLDTAKWSSKRPGPFCVPTRMYEQIPAISQPH